MKGCDGNRNGDEQERRYRCVRTTLSASIEAASGKRDQALARVRAIERRDDIDHHVAYSLGTAWAQLGDSAASVRWLRQAADTGFACSPWFSRDTLLDPVRADPAFRELMSGMLTRGASDSRR